MYDLALLQDAVHFRNIRNASNFYSPIKQQHSKLSSFLLRAIATNSIIIIQSLATQVTLKNFHDILSEMKRPQQRNAPIRFSIGNPPKEYVECKDFKF